MNQLLRNIVIPVLALLLSCDKPGSSVSCSDCTETEPTEVKVEITFDPYQEGMYKEPEINIYEGNIEDRILIKTYTPDSSPTEYSVYINKKYTITTTYYYFGHTVIAVDSVTPRVRFESDQCDKPCYFVYDNKVDLRIKYRE